MKIQKYLCLLVFLILLTGVIKSQNKSNEIGLISGRIIKTGIDKDDLSLTTIKLYNGDSVIYQDYTDVKGYFHLLFKTNEINENTLQLSVQIKNNKELKYSITCKKKSKIKINEDLKVIVESIKYESQKSYDERMKNLPTMNK